MIINMKNYYEENADRYIEDTVNCDMSVQYNLFLKYINKGKILDIGFGSGRDMRYFKTRGFVVEGLDPTETFINLVKDEFKVYKMSAEDLSIKDEYDGIWACASLLHVNRVNLNDVFKRCSNALKNNGIMYVSFKYGDYEGIYKERYFNFINEDILNEVIKDTNLSILEIIYTDDVRKDRDDKWINVVLKKKQKKVENLCFLLF